MSAVLGSSSLRVLEPVEGILDDHLSVARSNHSLGSNRRANLDTGCVPPSREEQPHHTGTVVERALDGVTQSRWEVVRIPRSRDMKLGDPSMRYQPAAHRGRRDAAGDLLAGARGCHSLRSFSAMER